MVHLEQFFPNLSGKSEEQTDSLKNCRFGTSICIFLPSIPCQPLCHLSSVLTAGGAKSTSSRRQERTTRKSRSHCSCPFGAHKTNNTNVEPITTAKVIADQCNTNHLCLLARLQDSCSALTCWYNSAASTNAARMAFLPVRSVLTCVKQHRFFKDLTKKLPFL